MSPSRWRRDGLDRGMRSGGLRPHLLVHRLVGPEVAVSSTAMKYTPDRAQPGPSFSLSEPLKSRRELDARRIATLKLLLANNSSLTPGSGSNCD